MLILAGDIGGTKTELALYERSGDEAGGREVESARFESRGYPTFDDVVIAFLHGRRVDSAGFAVAGPVVGGRCQATNLPWTLDTRELSILLDAPVGLLNDFAATVRGIPELPAEDFEVLADGVCDPQGPFVVLGAGTGLGEGVGVPTTSGLRVLASEGGHTDFAPRNELEIELLRFLQRRHKKRISVERAVSGPGLIALHAFVIEHGLAAGLPETAREMAQGDPAEVIGRRGSSGEDPACARALSLFATLYGAEAGNLALKVLPTGGVFVAGGMAPKLIAILRRGEFMQAMLDKGRMSPLIASMRVSVVMNARVGLLGARAEASMVYRSGPVL